MPIYEYAPLSDGCAQCGGRFDRLESLHAEPLTSCPECGQPVRRVISAASVVAGQSQRLGEKHIGAHGFTQYRNVGKGKYEKTTGKGPDTIEG